mmetsp:Transcript_118810/g.233361  ORF Transcript_118810/g.233361 Transcript_118810/m.233361 type:complete len:84 (+) Transcript_118810:766-1017(+)
MLPVQDPYVIFSSLTDRFIFTWTNSHVKKKYRKTVQNKYFFTQPPRSLLLLICAPPCAHNPLQHLLNINIETFNLRYFDIIII